MGRPRTDPRFHFNKMRIYHQHEKMGMDELMQFKCMCEEGLLYEAKNVGGRRWTVGYGHDMYEPKVPYKRIILQQAIDLFKRDWENAKRRLELKHPNYIKTIGPIRYLILVEMTYNLGAIGRFKKACNLLNRLWDEQHDPGTGMSEHLQLLALNEIWDSKYAQQLPDRCKRNMDLWINNRVDAIPDMPLKLHGGA